MDQPANIYLLVGFFGSGKTTLIRRLLANTAGRRYAIIQNEFAEGEMGIEQPLIMDETGTPFNSYLELPNGCICCSAKNDLVAAVEHILDNTPVRSVVVETNGLADPAQSIKQFWFDEQMNIRAVLHSVVAVVSARRWPALRNDPLLEKQLVFANKVLLTFLDVAAENRPQMEQQVRGVNAECELAGGEVDLGAFLEGKSLFCTDWERQLVGSEPTHHPGGVRPVFLRGRATAGSKGELERMVGELLWQSGLEILRIKGVVCLQDSPTVLELQGVEDIFEVKETATPVSVYQGESRILAVGKGLEKGQLLAALGIIEPQ